MRKDEEHEAGAVRYTHLTDIEAERQRYKLDNTVLQACVFLT